MRVKITELVGRIDQLSMRKTLLVSAMLGMLVFVGLFGVRVLNPTYDDWLFGKGDLTQHYTGWEFFRQSKWGLPLGRIDNLATPIGTSVVYTDSIPLFAIFFKLFNPILPGNFQYFGLWGILSIAAQSVLATLIISRFNKSRIIALTGGALIALAPFMVFRMYMHTALAGQWIILAALCLVVYRRDVTSRRGMWLWAALFGVAGMVHAYFLPMVATLFMTYLILTFQNYKRLVIEGLVPILAGLTSLWLAGGFVTKDVVGGLLGKFGADLNTFLNPIEYSYFLKSLPTAPEAYEGMAYLGLGVLILLIWGVSDMLLKTRSRDYRKIFRNKRLWFAALPIAALSVFSIGNMIYVNGKLLLHITLPHSIDSLLATFRSTGRFTWVLGYIIMLAAIIYFGVRTSRQARVRVAAVMVLILLLQGIDVRLSPGLRQKRQITNAPIVVNNQETNMKLSSIFSGKQHIVSLDDDIGHEAFFLVAPSALTHHMTISDAYLARKSQDFIAARAQAVRRHVVAGTLEQDTVYITSHPELAERINQTVSGDASVVTDVVSGIYMIAKR